MLTEPANNAPAAQVNNDLNEGKLFKTRRNLRRLESATLLLGSESDVDYTLLSSVVLPGILAMRRILKRLGFQAHPAVPLSANQAATGLQRCARLLEETRHAGVAQSAQH